jgi:hypothetical protein
LLILSCCCYWCCCWGIHIIFFQNGAEWLQTIQYAMEANTRL